MYSIDSAPPELADAIREFFPSEQWDNAASIAKLESDWRWDALDDTTTVEFPCGATIRTTEDNVAISAERSIGFFQINSCNYPNWNHCHFYNTRQNVGTAHALWAERGWSPWYFSSRQLGLA